MMMRFSFIVFLLPWLGMAVADSNTTSAYEVDICYDYACNTQSRLTLTRDEWQNIAALFNGIKDSANERQSIRQAIAQMEQAAGRQTPTFRDRGGNNKFLDDEEAGHMDCIDESLNTTRYLRLFEKNGLLRKHRVRERVSRSPYIFDFHWGAVIEELGSGRRYVVDSWHFDNGQPPVIQALGDWLEKRDFNE
jgi:hypothetical protein